jgi:hypothetical protein
MKQRDKDELIVLIHLAINELELIRDESFFAANILIIDKRIHELQAMLRKLT